VDVGRANTIDFYSVCFYSKKLVNAKKRSE
jgi:hypothetical protein